MALIYLVRHAQASFGTEHYDRLSELGRRQSRWLGEHFRERGLEFSRAYSGSLERQRDTATDVLAAMRSELRLQILPGLDEYPGDAIYRSHAGARSASEHQRADYRDYWRTFRAAMSAWSEDRLDDVPETWREFGTRVRLALETSAQGAGRDERVLVVSSGGAIGRAVADIVGAPAAAAIELNLQFRNTGMCELIANAGRLRLLSFNHIPHLERGDRDSAISAA